MDILLLTQCFVASFTCLAMLFAAYSDMRTREIPDIYWKFIGAVGIAGWVLTAIVKDVFGLPAALAALAQVLFLISVLCETRVDGTVLEIISVALALIPAVLPDGTLIHSVPVFFCVLFHVLYSIGIVRGGADAKALMAISIAIPAYPDLGFGVFAGSGALESLMVPSFSVLFLASVLSVVGCAVYCIIRNRGISMPGFYCGYMMPVADVCGSFVWPAEDIVDGKRCRCGIPDEGGTVEICDRFRSLGLSEIYVTPMVPFVVPIAFSLIFIVLFGSPLFIL